MVAGLLWLLAVDKDLSTSVACPSLKPWREIWLLCEIIAVTDRWQFHQEQIEYIACCAGTALMLALTCFSCGVLWLPEVEEAAEMQRGNLGSGLARLSASTDGLER